MCYDIYQWMQMNPSINSLPPAVMQLSFQRYFECVNMFIDCQWTMLVPNHEIFQQVWTTKQLLKIRYATETVGRIRLFTQSDPISVSTNILSSQMLSQSFHPHFAHPVYHETIPKNILRWLRGITCYLDGVLSLQSIGLCLYLSTYVQMVTTIHYPISSTIGFLVEVC